MLKIGATAERKCPKAKQLRLYLYPVFLSTLVIQSLHYGVHLTKLGVI